MRPVSPWERLGPFVPGSPDSPGGSPLAPAWRRSIWTRVGGDRTRPFSTDSINGLDTVECTLDFIKNDDKSTAQGERQGGDTLTRQISCSRSLPFAYTTWYHGLWCLACLIQGLFDVICHVLSNRHTLSALQARISWAI